jgi:hypothetical protein
VTEQQRYSVQARHGDVELRDYDDCVVADVVVTGSAEQAGNRAFRPLVSYISGNNQSSASLAMTAPVIQESVMPEPASERLAMTAPVIQETAGNGRWTVSFVLPGARPLEEYPVPSDPRVSLRAVPGETVAALRWAGRWTEGNVARRTEELQAALIEAGWVAVGPPRWARFDPPWKPPFARRNEIVIPVLRPLVTNP